MYDIFKITGVGEEKLVKVLEILFGRDSNGEIILPRAYYFSPEKGLVLCSYIRDHSKPFTNLIGDSIQVPMNELSVLIMNFIQSELYHFKEGDDGEKTEGESCTLGWMIYKENCGHINTSSGTVDHSSIAAIKPYWYYFGK